MKLNEYQSEAIDTAIYPKEEGMTYAVLGLVGESGEIGDVLWYVANLANEIGMTLDEVATLNLIKVRDRTLRHKIQGNGDYR